MARFVLTPRLPGQSLTDWLNQERSCDWQTKANHKHIKESIEVVRLELEAERQRFLWRRACQFDQVHVPYLVSELNQLVNVYTQDHKQRQFCVPPTPITNVSIIKSDTFPANAPFPERIPFPDRKYVVVIERDSLASPITSIKHCVNDSNVDILCTERHSHMSPIVDIRILDSDECGGSINLSNYTFILSSSPPQRIICLYKTADAGMQFVPLNGFSDPSRDFPKILPWNKEDVPVTGFQIVAGHLLPCNKGEFCVTFSNGIHVHGIFGEGSPIVHAEFSRCMPRGETVLDWIPVTDMLYLGFACNWSILWRNGKQVCPSLAQVHVQ